MEEFYRIPSYPNKLTATTTLTRLLDGLGFRFYWSTEGLQPKDYHFRPAPDIKSIEELVDHIWELMNWVSTSSLNKPYTKPNNNEDTRKQTLEIIYDLRSTMIAMNDEDLKGLRIRDKPFWNIINGPFSDALTHIGQINSFRRLAGNPVLPAKVFLGEPPERKT